MADQIKEISNGTYTIGALSNGVPIASTDADTQYVVKDITVRNNTLSSVGATLDFVVNNVNVADIDASVTGSEIIDVSSTAVARATASTFRTSTIEVWMPTNTTGSRVTTITNRLVNDVTASSVTTQSAALTGAPSSGTQLVSWAFIGSNFYYWFDEGNSSQGLYRRAGGVNGTETAVPNISSYHPVVFDGVDKFYWVTASQIYTHNATTNTNTAVNLNTTGGVSWPGSLPSYPRISFANGLVFWCNNAQTESWAINPSTGRMARIGNTVAATNNGVFLVYHTGGTYYLVTTADVGANTTGTLYVSTISDTVVGPLTTTNTLGNWTFVYGQSTYTPRNALNGYWPKIMPNGDFVFMSLETSGSVYVYKRFNVVTQTFATPFTINVSTITPNAGGSYSAAPFRTISVADDSANKLNTTFYPQSATLRVTGVETTL